MRTLTWTEAQERAALISTRSYRVELDLTTGPETFRSRSEVRFGCTTPGASSFAELVAERVRALELNGRRLDPADVLHGDRIRLDDLQADNVLVVEADCAYSHTGEGLHRFTDPSDDETYLYTQLFLYEAQRVYACFDQPDLKATYDVALHLPPRWLGVANAAAVERPDGEDGGRWRFATTPPLSTYFVLVAAGPYARYDDERTDGSGRRTPLAMYVRRSLAPFLEPDLPELFTVTKDGLDFFEREFGVPYPFDKYDQLYVPEFNAGAMENPGAVTIRDEYVHRSRVTERDSILRCVTVLHEMAHMWFGDLVTMRWWNDLWLNESFAEYLGVLATAEATRYREAWADQALTRKAWGFAQDQQPTTHPVATDVGETASALLNFDGISYAKGAAVLKQLSAYVTRERFFAGVGRYFRDHAYGNTSLQDLLDAVGNAAGTDLVDWSRRWLETSQVNTLRPVLDVDGGGRVTSLVVEQTAHPEHPTLRPHRLAVACHDLVPGPAGAPDGARLVPREQLLDVTVDGPATPVPGLEGRLRPDLIVLDHGDRTWAKLRLDERSLTTFAAHASAVEDSLTRAQLWLSAWDMVRDGELGATRYTGMVLRHVGAEPVVALAQRLLDTVRIAADVYASPERRTGVLRAAAGTAVQLLDGAEPGSDLQLAYVDALALTAVDGAHLERLRGLLDGSGVPAGLDVGADLRWRLLRRLVVLGAAGEVEIAAELERDRTAAGQVAARRLRAARPDAAAKEEAFASVLPTSSLSNRHLEAVAAGFWQPEQLDLARPFVQRYLDALPELWATQTEWVAADLTSGLYPTLLTDDDTAAAVDAVLGRDDLPPGLRRLLAEGRADTDRARRARATDAAEPAGAADAGSPA